MTDRPTTNQDLQATLAVIEQSLENTDIRTHLGDIEQQLGAMYSAAETAGNESAMVAINNSWARIQEMAQHGQTYKEAALTSIDLAKTFQNQRNNALKELEDLTDAVENMDNDHPLVSDLIEAVEEGVYEWQGLVEGDNMAEAMYEQRQEYRYALKQLTGLKEASNHFFDVLDGESQFTPEQLNLLKQLLNSLAATATISDVFGPDADDDWGDEDGDDNDD